MNVGSTSCTLHPGALKHKKMDNSKKNGQKMDNLVKQETGSPRNEVEQT